MTWEARLDGRNSLVVEEGVGILGAIGPMSRTDEEHERAVLKAAAAEDLLEAAKRWLYEFDLYNVPPRQQRHDAERALRAAIAKAGGQ